GGTRAWISRQLAVLHRPLEHGGVYARLYELEPARGPVCVPDDAPQGTPRSTSVLSSPYALPDARARAGRGGRQLMDHVELQRVRRWHGVVLQCVGRTTDRQSGRASGTPRRLAPSDNSRPAISEPVLSRCRACL